MKFYDMVSKTDIYLANAKKQYKIWRKSYRCCTKKYSNHVTKIIDIFDLKGKNQFDKKLAPKFWAGDIANRKPRFIIVSLNPGLPKKQKMSSRDIDAMSWNAYMEKRRNWFTNPNFKTSDYWQKNSKLICGINKQPEKEMDGEYTLKNVLNLNLFPYHSNKSED